MNIFFQYTAKIKKLLNDLKKKGKIILPNNLDSIFVDIPPKNFSGDISCNVAMILSKINKDISFATTEDENNKTKRVRNIFIIIRIVKT